MQLSMFSSEEHPVNRFRSPAFDKGLLTHAGTSCLSLVQFLNDISPNGWYGRTSPACCPVTEDGILEPFSGCWGNSGMGSPTGFLTLNTLEFPVFQEPSHSDEGVCSLSDILETGDHLQRHCLSEKACQGILRRAEKRGQRLPPFLRDALLAVASEQTSTATED